MKNFAYIIASALLALGAASCDNRPEVFGSWQGKYDFNIPVASTSYANADFTFGRDGSVDALYLVDMTVPVAQQDGLVSPYELSVSATATVNGTWQYVQRENDEVAVSFDASTVKVNVDPEALEMRANVITDQQMPQIDSLRPVLVEKYASEISKAIPVNLLMEDVKVQGSSLFFEVDDAHYEFRSANQ